MGKKILMLIGLEKELLHNMDKHIIPLIVGGFLFLQGIIISACTANSKNPHGKPKVSL